jgi:predicted phosphodiesterase
VDIIYMKIQLISDLHLEGYEQDEVLPLLESIVNSAADTLVIAGDLCEIESLNLETALSYFCGFFKRVLYVPGNHEYYHTTFKRVKSTLNTFMRKYHNLYCFPNPGMITLDETTFAVGTLWFPRSPEVETRKQFLNDFKHIKNFESWVYDENQTAIELFINRTVDVVISHHLPSYRSVDERYQNSTANCYYVSDILHKVQQLPKYWFHGHTHTPMDYMAGDCNVICNPVGYKANAVKNDVVIEL